MVFNNRFELTIEGNVSMPKVKWREYLKGKYEIDDEGNRSKMLFDIRKRATQMMEDLGLICEKLPEKDKILIFQNPRTYDAMWSSLVKLMGEIGDIPQDVKDVRKFQHSKEIQELIKGLETHGIRYDLERLFRDENYLKARRDLLEIKSR